MSRTAQEFASAGARSAFDPVVAPWFFPILTLAVLLLLRVLAPDQAEKPELSWLDLALRVRAQSGYSEALDPEIRFVKLKMDEQIARRTAMEGEYAITAGILNTLAACDVRVIVVDINYAYGRIEDQRILADAIREIHERGHTTVVLATAIEGRNEKAYLLRPLSEAGGEAFPQGIVNVPAGSHWREYQLVHRFRGETLPSLALAAYGASRSSVLAPKVISEGVMEWIELGGDGKPVKVRADDSRLFLNLRHSYFDKSYEAEDFGGRIWTVENIERFAGRGGDSDSLRDTIVFLGFDEDTDGKPTTHGEMEPGMILHGTALHDLMHGTAIRPVPFWVDTLLHVLVALFAAVVFSLLRSQRWLPLVASVGIVFILGSGWYAVWVLHFLPATISIAVLWGSSVVLEVGRRWTFELRERTSRDAMLGFYFSPAVLKQVTQNLDMIRPRGGDVAVLLSDLRGFTMLCETQPVERVFELLNRLFAVETDAALREDGSLARFAGDQFLAYWGAPEPCTDAPDRALRAALEIYTILRARRESPGADELDAWLQIGIGLHCGRGLVGHVGSRSYRDYNIVGDSVNTTARIEGQTKHYAAAILASGDFIAALEVKPISLLVDRVQVKGKSRPTDLHAVFAETEPETAEGMRFYTGAFSLYEAGEFASAEVAFAALTEHPHPTIATSARLLGERCVQFVESPPAEWDGVFELTSK